MRILFFLLLGTFRLTSNRQEVIDFTWSKPKYTTVKAYLYGLEDVETSDLIILNGRLSRTVVDTVGVTLNNEQIKSVLSFVNGKIQGKLIIQNECFIPHHGIVFYDQIGNPVAYISICLYCRQFDIFPKTKEPEMGLEVLEKVIRELGFPVFNHPDGYLEYGKRLRKGN